jgi:uncharacterized protein YhbP (UPF0306 family)
MPELIATLEAMNEKEHNQRKFAASLKGIQLDDEVKQESKTFDDIKRKALGIDTSADDVVSLQGSFASEAGFGIGMGLGYSKE